MMYRFTDPERSRPSSLCGHLLSLVLVLAPFLAVAGRAHAQVTAPAAPYTAGFRAIYHVDLAREWAGDTSVGRPIRAFVWYPAVPGTGRAMRFGDYFVRAPAPALRLVMRLDSALDARANESFTRWMGAGPFGKLRVSRVDARRNATPMVGSFPVIAYSAGLNDSFEASNSDLFEFLAAQGFIVITVPQLGATAASLDLDVTPADLETQARDLEEALALVRADRALAPDSVIFMGHSMGGTVALVTAMRHPAVRAVVGLDASYAAPGLSTTLAANPYFRPKALAAPVLDLRRADTAWVFGNLSALSGTSCRVVQVEGMSHMGFTNDARITDEYLAGTTAALALRRYHFVRELIVSFLRAAVGRDSAALARFDQELVARSAGMAVVTAIP